jgi:hypothetical protein
MTGKVLAGFADRDAPCNCRKCWAANPKHTDAIVSVPFIVCSTCGNKRCPHATDHNLACTGSNEPGQKGSAYE